MTILDGRTWMEHLSTESCRELDVTHAHDRSRLNSRPLMLWTPGEKDHWVRIRPTEVTGRRIHSIVDGERAEFDGETES